jgi:ATP-binding cassette subfamily F protein 3
MVKSNEQLSHLPNILGSFGFGAGNMDKTCGVLSGGEKIRLCFARIFVNPPNLLILDEPTTHLDIAAREALQEALAQYNGTVCLVSHDIEFVREVADTIVAMRPPGIRKYFGNYEYYLEKSAQENLNVAEENIVIDDKAAQGINNSENTFNNSKERRRERARKRQEIAATKKKAEKALKVIESKIEKLEFEQAETAKLLAGDTDSGLTVDFAQVNRRLAELQSELDKCGAEWEKAMENFEEIMELNDAINA